MKNLYYKLYYKVRRLILWANISRRRKFKAALVKYEHQLKTWEKSNSGPPPIVWYPPDNDYIWATRDMRRSFQTKIKTQIKKGVITHGN